MAFPLTSRTRHRAQALLVGLAIVGAIMGLANAWHHLTTDPLADVRAYYDAGARLNAGEPLYVQGVGTDDPAFYRYPPLLAIAFRPLALLPYEVAALLWEALVLAAFVWSVWRLGPRRPAAWIALGLLALPTLWALVIGQAQVIVTALLVLASPWAVALAANIKVFPILVAVYWLGRRDGHALGRFALVMLGLGALQFVLAPEATIAYLGFLSPSQVGDVNNLSPYAISPAIWLLLVIAGIVATIWLAPTRWGWAAAVAMSVLATPRLLSYQLSTLLATLREPDDEARSPDATGPRDAA